MDNKKKKYVRRGASAGGFFLFAFSLMTFAGLELPFYNHYNPLYNPYPWILMGFMMFIARTYIRDKKGVGNFIDFFDRSGLVVASYEIPFENITPTHANYLDKAGEKKSVHHTHPFAIPSADQWTNEFLVPSNGLESLNPTKLIEKYGAKLQLTDEEKDALLSLEGKMPEIAALDPQVLHETESNADSVDQLNLEAGYQVSEVRKGWFSGTKTQQIVMFVLVGVMAGFMAATLTYMAGHIDFAHLNGVISP